MYKESQEPEILLTFSDVKAIGRRWRTKIALGAIVGSFVVGLYVLMQPLKYNSKGSFIEKGKPDAQLTADNFASALFKGESKERLALVAIKSRKILESAIQKLDLQASIKPENGWPLMADSLLKALDNIPKNLQAEYASLTWSEKLVLEDSLPEIIAEQVHYIGEEPLYLQLKPFSGNKFLVKERSSGREIGTAKEGEPFHSGGIEFTLQRTSTDPLFAEEYRLTLLPLSPLALKLSKKMHISSDYNSKSFLDLSLVYHTRHGANRLLNAIMDGYREHLVNEHHRLVSTQIDYLKQRQDHIDLHTAQLIEAQAAHMTVPSRDLELLVSTQKQLTKRLLAIDLQLKQLHKCAEGGRYLYAGEDNDAHLAKIQQMITEIERDRQEGEAIALNIGKSSGVDRPGRLEHLDPQFEGIDLETAKSLYLSYSQEQHRIEAQLAQHQYMASQVLLPGFELSSLSATLTDSVSQGIISSASALSVALKDANNRTNRELERLEFELALQKNILSGHLKQSADLLGIRQELLKNHIQGIQLAMLTLMDQRVELREKHLSDLLLAGIEGLKQEQRVIRQQLQELQQELGKMPSHWVGEKLVDLHLEANGMVLQQIGSLIETKNIADNLDATLSAPFDRATLPVQPNGPYLMLYILFGSVLGSLAIFGIALVRSAMTGVEASCDNLIASGQHVSGKLGDNQAQETLRRLMTHLCPAHMFHRSLLLMLGQGADYSTELAELLRKRGQKALIISTSFDQQPEAEQLPGLLQYLQGTCAQPKVTCGDSFDSIAAGGITDFGPELMESQLYQQLLDQLVRQYDWVIVTTRVSPASADAESLLANFENAAISIVDEKLQNLKPILSLSQKKNITYLVNQPHGS